MLLSHVEIYNYIQQVVYIDISNKLFTKKMKLDTEHLFYLDFIYYILVLYNLYNYRPCNKNLQMFESSGSSI